MTAKAALRHIVNNVRVPQPDEVAAYAVKLTARMVAAGVEAEVAEAVAVEAAESTYELAVQLAATQPATLRAVAAVEKVEELLKTTEGK